MLFVGLLLLVGVVTAAAWFGPGPTRRRVARGALALCALFYASEAGMPAAQQSPLIRDVGLLGVLCLGVGLLATRGRRRRRGYDASNGPPP